MQVLDVGLATDQPGAHRVLAQDAARDGGDGEVVDWCWPGAAGEAPARLRPDVHIARRQLGRCRQRLGTHLCEGNRGNRYHYFLFAHYSTTCTQERVIRISTQFRCLDEFLKLYMSNVMYA